MNISRPNICLADMPSLERQLSLEETYTLADKARRKSSDKFVREDLRLKLGHTNVLDFALKDIAARTPPPSPTQSTCSMYATPKSKPATITWATEVVVSHVEEVDYDDYGFSYNDDGEEDLGGLALTRTSSKR